MASIWLPSPTVGQFDAASPVDSLFAVVDVSPPKYAGPSFAVVRQAAGLCESDIEGYSIF